MKKLITMFAICAMVLTACTSTDEPQPETTIVKINYPLSESGSMTRIVVTKTSGDVITITIVKSRFQKGKYLDKMENGSE